jgi:hypothetical protein
VGEKIKKLNRRGRKEKMESHREKTSPLPLSLKRGEGELVPIKF